MKVHELDWFGWMIIVSIISACVITCTEMITEDRDSYKYETININNKQVQIRSKDQITIIRGHDAIIIE